MILLCSLVLVTLITIMVWIHGRQKAVEKIPGLPGLPIIGNTWSALNLGPEHIFKYVRKLPKHERINKMTALHMRFIGIYNPDDVEILLSTTRFNDKKNIYNFLQPWLCEGLLISNGQKWKLRRKLLTPAFHFNILKSFCKTFYEQTNKVLSKIEEEIKNMQTDITPLISIFTLQVMCETSMGTSINSDPKELTDKYFNPIQEMGQILAMKVFSVPSYFSWIYKHTSLAKEEKHVIMGLHEFTNKIIQERKTLKGKKMFIESADRDESKYRKQRPAMLDLLLQHEEEGTLDINGIREEVDTFMFEGHDTSSVALNYLIMNIANDSRVQDLIYEEMQSIFGKSQRVPTMEDLGAMKYLECVIKETLRLYPSVPAIAREITEDVVLSGYTVPAGSTAIIHVFDIHRDPDFFPDPEKFIPERFLPDNERKRHTFSYIPFSAGPRNCIGQRFAMLELKTMAAGLVRRFRLEPITKPQDLVFLTEPVLRPKDPIYVRFRLRT